MNKKSEAAALVLSILFLFVIKYVIDQNLPGIPQILQLVIYALLPVAGGSALLFAGALLETFADLGTSNSVSSQFFKRISEGPARNFLLGFLVVAYVGLIRPPLVFQLPFLPYLEWVLIAMTVYVLYSLTRLPLEGFYVGTEMSNWKKHVQQVRRETGRDLTRVTSVMEAFVDYGVKEPLLVYLSLTLQRMGETEEGILKTLKPLVEYQKKHGARFLLFPWTKRRRAERNRKARKNLLDTLHDRIDRMRHE